MQQIDNERDEEKSNIRVVSLIGKAPKRHLGLYRFESDRPYTFLIKYLYNFKSFYIRFNSYRLMVDLLPSK